MSNNWHENVFFGLHFDLHANANDNELGKNLDKDELIRELKKVNPDFVQCDCKGHPGYTCYPSKSGISAPGIIKDSLRIWKDAAKELGIPLVMHYSGVWDSAVLKLHPEWARVKHSKYCDDVENICKDENMVCLLSKYTDEYMIEQMLEIIDLYDVDGFWVDGENWAVAPCYCINCKEEFDKQYGLKIIPEKQGDIGWDQWLTFTRNNFVNHVKKYTEAIHKRKPECTVCSNWMYTVRQPEEISAPIDYLSGDFPFIWSASKAIIEAKFMDNRNISWDLMAWGFTSYGPAKAWTFKSVPALCREAAVVMANGGSFMIYDQPERSGELIKWHMDKMAEVAKFCRARQQYCQYTRSLPQVALMHSKDHYYKNNSPSFNFGQVVKPLEGALHTILENHYHIDILNDSDFMRRKDEYKLCIVAEQNRLPLQQILELKEYVKNGGRLIVSGPEQTKLFDDITGVEDLGIMMGEGSGDSVYITDGNESFFAIGDWRLTKNAGDAVEVEPILTGREVGKSAKRSNYHAAVVNKYGDGYIACIFGSLFGCYADSHYPGARRFVKKIISKMNITGLVGIDAPLALNISLREKNNMIFIHFINLGSNKPLSPDNAYIEDVPACGPVNVVIEIDCKPKLVYLAPSCDPVFWVYEQNQLTVKVSSVGIYDILVIEK